MKKGGGALAREAEFSQNQRKRQSKRGPVSKAERAEFLRLANEGKTRREIGRITRRPLNDICAALSGEKTQRGRRKINPEQVTKLAAQGFTQRRIASLLGVSQGAVCVNLRSA